MSTTLIRIDDEAHAAGLAAPLQALTKAERFSLLIKRGARQEEECRKHYGVGVIDMQDALIKAGFSKDIATAAANKLIAEYK